MEPPSPVGKNLSPEQVQRDVHRLIVEQGVDNETFFDWVTANVGKENVKQHYFIRALTSAVCRSIIVEGKSGQCRCGYMSTLAHFKKCNDRLPVSDLVVFRVVV